MTLALVALIAIGTLGYLLLLPALLDLRWALGKRSAGLGRILVDGLLGLVVLMFVLFGLSLVRMSVPVTQTVTWEGGRLLLAALFAAHPVWVLWQLTDWRKRLEAEDAPLPVAVEKAIVVSLEEDKEKRDA